MTAVIADMSAPDVDVSAVLAECRRLEERIHAHRVRVEKAIAAARRDRGFLENLADDLTAAVFPWWGHR